MKRIIGYGLLAIVTLVAPIAGRSPAPQAKVPQAKVRELATIPGVAAGSVIRMPNGRVVLYTAGDGIFAYDLASKRSILVTRGFDGELGMSRAGDRIAYDHESTFLWSTPIDPKTGAAAGPSQRVSVRAGDEASFSPDGKLIAFESFEGTKDLLTVVPVTGGPERVLAEYEDTIHNICWSADGKWIFVLLGRSTIERVPAAGGPSEKLISTSGSVLGPFDGRIAFYRSDALAQSEGRMAYTTTSGARGEFRVPPGSSSGDWSGGNYTLPLWLLTTTTRPSTAHILDLADGTVRDLVPGAVQSKAEAWSPDGRRLAVQTGTAEHNEITVMNDDGSQRRRYSVSVPGHFRWSPNGDMLAYYGAPGFRTVAVLNIATGATRVVFSALPNGWVPDYVWRPDGKSIVLVKQALPLDGRSEVYETGLDGVERKLRDIGAEFPSRPYFISDQLLFGGTASERFVIPTSGGTPLKLPGSGRRNPNPGVSGDGKWLLLPVPNPDGRLTSVELMTSGGDSIRTLKLPFEVGTCCWNAPFHPDGKHLILGGRIPGESESKIFMVPLNGDAPRVLSQFPRLISTSFLSPDGKNLVFTSEGSSPTTKIYELDVSPIQQAAAKR